MRRAVALLLLVGLAQWGALGWWRYVDGVTVELSLGRMFRELLGVTPRVAWDPAERLLSAFFELSPGTLCLLLAGHLILRHAISRLIAGGRDLYVERLRRELEKDRR